MVAARRVADLERIESAAVAGAKGICCVSAALADHLSEKHLIPRAKIDVVHCGADPSFEFNSELRRRVRGELHLNGELVLCHLGGLGSVHRPDRVVSFISALHKIGADVALLLLSRDLDAMELVKAQLPSSVRVFAKSAEAAQIPGYLCAADAGLLMLDEALRNAVSFPVKFSEYSCCGLPVIATGASRDPARYIEASGFGMIVDEAEQLGWRATVPAESLTQGIERLRKVSSSQREAQSTAAAEIMRFDHTASTLRDIYSILLEDA